MKQKKKVVKRQPTKAQLKNVKTIWASIDKPSGFRNDSAEENKFYSVTVVFEKGDDTHKRLVKGFKNAAKGLPEAKVKRLIKNKINELSEKDLDANEDFHEGMRKVTFKNKKQPEVYDFRNGKNIKSKDTKIWSGDVVSLEAVLKVVEFNGIQHLGSYVQHIALVESVSPEFSDPSDWYAEHGEPDNLDGDEGEDEGASDDEVEVEEEEISFDDFEE